MANSSISVDSSISVISHIHSQTADFLIKELKDAGFENFVSSHGNILFQLNKNGKMSMGELAKLINRDKSTTTVLVRKLEKENFVVLEPFENDKRNKIIALTEKGFEYTKAMQKISQDLQKTFYKGFSDDEKILFCKFLEKIQNNFDFLNVDA